MKNLDSLKMVLENKIAVLESAVDTLSSSLATVAPAAADAGLSADNVWMMVATALVFIMHLGFAGVEAGFTQSKNTVNILFKNTLTPAIGLLMYAFFGFAMMYPGEWTIAGVLSLGFWLDPPLLADGSLDLSYNEYYTYWTDFLFQGMFAATAATIVSGAVAERIKISSYLVFTVFFVGFIYPIIGSWQWGAGFLSSLDFMGTDGVAGFHDFAGSTLVHSVGGWGALAGIMLLGSRIGKYANGKVYDFPGSSVPLATIGVFLLWLGWFGFNGGSVLSADPAGTSIVLVTTSLAAAAGALGGGIMAYILFERLDLGMVLNGILAGLVGITAGADLMNPGEAIVIGLIAGLLVALSAVTLDRFKLDDCVGAVSVHLTCGIWGTLAVGIFGAKAGFTQFIYQLTGVAAAGVLAFGAAFLIFYVLKSIWGIRVSEEHESSGLDSHEHGIRGYTITYDQ